MSFDACGEDWPVLPGETAQALAADAAWDLEQRRQVLALRDSEVYVYTDGNEHGLFLPSRHCGWSGKPAPVVRPEQVKLELVADQTSKS